jgi:hypothetical protein
MMKAPRDRARSTASRVLKKNRPAAMPRAHHGTSFKSGQEPEELALRDVPAVAADDRGEGGDAAPGGREDLDRDDEREERASLNCGR